MWPEEFWANTSRRSVVTARNRPADSDLREMSVIIAEVNAGFCTICVLNRPRDEYSGQNIFS
ncbi:hypothetical protein KCP69_17575 [Salmonella enterica subsp. enterica]|nr:hypothetical protein KCP69_17575 [Salmonella enterica subsp. enterica]